MPESVLDSQHRLRLAQAKLSCGLAMAMIAVACIVVVPLAGRALWPSPPPPLPSGATASTPFGMSTDDLVLVILCLAITVNGTLVGLLLPRFLLAGEAHRAARTRGELPRNAEEAEAVDAGGAGVPTLDDSAPRGVPPRVYAAAATIRAGAFGFVGIFGVILVLLLGTLLPGLAAACIALFLLAMTFPSTTGYRRAVLEPAARGPEA